MQNSNIIIEGVDRTGKNTLIDGIMQRLGFFQTLHFQKPELLDYYKAQVRSLGTVPSEADQEALRFYQTASFNHMLKLLGTGSRFILNRSHIGEAVYAKRYRGYDGNYVFDLEQLNLELDHRFDDSTLLVLLHTSSFDFIKDDGLSFDFSKKEEEQADFIKAFNRSKIQNKLMIDVNCENSFVPVEQILDLVIERFKASTPETQRSRFHRGADGTYRELIVV